MFEKISEVYDYTWNRGIPSIWSDWKEAVERPDIRIQLIALSAVVTFYLWVIPGFFRYIQNRDGFMLYDPVLKYLPAMDLSVYCFGILYLSVIATVFYLFTKPDQMIKGLVGYTILLSLRLLMIYLVPLNPPSNIIPLEDPFIDSFFYVNMHITKDLFFSGHVSTMFILYLAVDQPKLRQLLIAGCIFVAVILLFQHVHYTLDVIAAPFFAWIAYRAAERVHQRLFDSFGQEVKEDLGLMKSKRS